MGNSSMGVQDGMAVLAQVASLRHFAKHLVVLTTLWKILPDVAVAMGANPFKQVFGGFVDSLAYSATCGDHQTVAAARSCVAQLDALLGRESFCECVRTQNAQVYDSLTA